MAAGDLDAVDETMRLAFGTIRGLDDPMSAFGDADLARTRFRAAPEQAWVAEIGGEVVGSVFAARWGSFGFLGPLSVRPDLWGRGIAGRLLDPVLDAFAAWEVRQAGLFTFAASPGHLALYQRHGFWPGALTVVAERTPTAPARTSVSLLSGAEEQARRLLLDDVRALTDEVFPGLDVGPEIFAAEEQAIGETVLVQGEAALEGVAVCHVGAGSEAGSDTCYVKVAAVRPGANAGGRFERLLDACEAFAASAGLGRLVAGVSAGNLDAYRRLLGRGFRAERVGVSMWLRPEAERFDVPGRYLLCDLR